MNMILTYLKGLAVVGLGRIIAGLVILLFMVQCYRTCNKAEELSTPKEVLTSKFKVTNAEMQSLIDSIVYREVTPKLMSLEIDSSFIDTATIEQKHIFFKKLRFIASNTPD